MKSKIGNLNEGNFEMECILCGNSELLATVAHRNREKIVGFVIACRYCRDRIYGGGFNLTVSENKTT